MYGIILFDYFLGERVVGLMWEVSILVTGAWFRHGLLCGSGCLLVLKVFGGDIKKSGFILEGMVDEVFRTMG